jgi:hypothetical protein
MWCDRPQNRSQNTVFVSLWQRTTATIAQEF